MPTMVRSLAKEELPLCIEHGLAFYQEFQLAGRFAPEVFLRNWNGFYDRDIGIVFGVWRDGVFVGGIGGLLAPDLFDDRLCVSEIFWFVDPAHRSGRGAIRLLDAYEDWGFAQGAVESRLVYMNGGVHDDRLCAFYERRGYARRETCFAKPLVNFSELLWP